MPHLTWRVNCIPDKALDKLSVGTEFSHLVKIGSMGDPAQQPG